MFLLCSILCFLVLPFGSKATSGNGMPVKYLSSCELDFNRDGKPDIALLIETKMGRELIVLIRG